MKNHHDTREPVCPWCGTVHAQDIPEQGERECTSCGKMFEIEYYATPSYNTAPLITCPECKRLVALDAFPTTGKPRISLHTNYAKNERCPASRTSPGDIQ